MVTFRFFKFIRKKEYLERKANFYFKKQSKIKVKFLI